MASAFGWKPAWEQLEDHPDFEGMDYYPLESDSNTVLGRLYEGDRFWDTDESYIIEIEAVKTKVYRGVVGPAGDEGNDCIFFTPDWEPPRDPTIPPHYTDDIHFLSVDKFIDKLDNGTLLPHRGNGLPYVP